MATVQYCQSAPMAPRFTFVFTMLLLIIPRFPASLALAQAAPTESLLSADQSPESLHRSAFPRDFIFGTGSSAYQVEGATTAGGKGTSIWDTFSYAGHIRDGSNADVSADQYHRFEEDVEILAEMNMDAYRFSISWTRIFPDGYGPDTNKDGIAYYNRLIDCLLSKGIKPYVTLSHWDLPQTLQDSIGGWINRQIVDYYAAFVEVCFAAFGDRVKNWLTVNEPAIFAATGYCDGRSPPARSSSPHTETYIVAHNFLLAHGAAVNIYRNKFQAQQGGVIGISLDIEFAAPLTNSSDDRDAAERRNEFQLSWFLDPIFFGDYPAVMRENVGSRLPRFSPDEIAVLHGSLDFIGLNHYTSKWATVRESQSIQGVCPTLVNDDQRVSLTVERNGVIIGPQYTSDARVQRDVFTVEPPVEDSLRDTLRVEYFREYLSAALTAVREGVDLRGYFAWSFLDSFEWANGFTRRYGLVYVDFSDWQKRYPKQSALWFQKFLQALPTYL